MEKKQYTITLHMVASLDGFIAKPDNSVAWFDTTHPYEGGTDFPSPEQYASMVDCYVMGANTYEHASRLAKDYGWPYGDVPTYVISHRLLPLLQPNIQQYAGDLQRLVQQILAPQFKKIWVVGGPSLVKAFLNEQLADEIRLPILPIVLATGRSFFEGLSNEQPLVLLNTTAFKNGMVELHYAIKKDS